MRRFGFLLFVAGVIVASWYAARYVPPQSIQGSGEHGAVTSMDRLTAWAILAGVPFACGAILMVVGGVIARRAMAKDARTDETQGAPLEDTHTMLLAIDAAVAALPTSEYEAHAAELRKQLDILLDDLIPAFLDVRQRHVAQLGAMGYAELSSAFAGMERSLARAWSAMTDEAWDEVPPSLDRARQSIAQALALTGQEEAH